MRHGKSLQYPLPKRGVVTGIDIAPNLIEQARARATAEGFDAERAAPVLWGDEETVKARFSEGISDLKMVRRPIIFNTRFRRKALSNTIASTSANSHGVQSS
jgi:hypothetical protein